MAGGRDFLAKLMGGAGGRPQVGADGYQRLLEENMGRVGYDRDQAVRSANIAGGFGNTTAQQYMHGMPPGGADAGVDPMATGGIPIPTPRPEAPLPEPTPLAATGPGIGSGIPTPTTPIVGAPVPTPRPADPSIGSGIPTPTSDQLAIPTPRPGGITLGDGPGIGSGMPTPSTPMSAPVPTSRQYGLKRQKPKTKKKA
jgi:hypothetical protein